MSNGNEHPVKKGRKAMNPLNRCRETILYWFERRLRVQGHASATAGQLLKTIEYEKNYAEKGIAAASSSLLTSERIFFLPHLDPKTMIAEGPSPADWTGYHAGKHGIWERFQNVKGESVNMGELFFKEKYRWIRSEYLKNPNNLKYITNAEAQKILDAAYKDAPRETISLKGIIDSEKFTQDVAKIFKQRGTDPKSTVWQGRYVYIDRATGKPSGQLGDLQTNVDFRYRGHNWRVAIDARTGRMLNIFRIDPNPKYGPMKFAEIAIKWNGKITDVQVHRAANSTITVEISATWRGLLKQGVKSGALSGGLIAGFLGALSGFKKEGIPGALKGLAIGAIVGAGVGAGFGGTVALLQRIWPWVGRVAKIAGFVGIIVAIVLDSSETALDPQEFGPNRKKDKDGNLWLYRNIEKKGTFFPEYIPHGIRIVCTDGTLLEFGDERGAASSYKRTPITVFARYIKVKWQMVRTPEGSSMWWWQENSTKNEHILTFEDDAAMMNALTRYDKEHGHRFPRTQN
jgi:hypothetical protein